jgi:hypothetical protein
LKDDMKKDKKLTFGLGCDKEKECTVATEEENKGTHRQPKNREKEQGAHIDGGK